MADQISDAEGRCSRLLRGVPPLPGWGPTSAPLFSCLRHVGQPVDYTFLAALSGDAFRLRVTELRPNGPGEGEEIARTLGELGYEVRRFLPWERDRIAAAIVETVTAGVPAIAWAPSTEFERWFGVVIGCDRATERVCLKTLGDQGDAFRTEPISRVALEREPGEPAAYVLGRKVSEPPLEELAWSALGHAVRLGREQVEVSPEKRCSIGSGVRAYEAWAGCLEQKGAGDRARLVEADTVHAVRMHLAVVVDMKEQAEAFLRSLLQTMQDEVRRQLENAAELYHEVGDLLARVQPRFDSFARCRESLGDKARTDDLIQTLRRVAFLENFALDAIARALHARR